MPPGRQSRCAAWRLCIVVSLQAAPTTSPTRRNLVQVCRPTPPHPTPPSVTRAPRPPVFLQREHGRHHCTVHWRLLCQRGRLRCGRWAPAHPLSRLIVHSGGPGAPADDRPRESQVLRQEESRLCAACRRAHQLRATCTCLHLRALLCAVSTSYGKGAPQPVGGIDAMLE